MIAPNQIYNADCLEMLQQIEDNSIDLVITSPPYNLGGDFHTSCKGKKRVTYGDYKSHNDNMDEEEYQQWQIKVIDELIRVIKPSGSIFYNHKNRLKNFKVIFPVEWLIKTKAIIRQEIVWDTTNEFNQDRRRFIPCHEKIYWLQKEITHIDNKRGLQDCWVFRNKLSRKITKHPATMPIEVVQEILDIFPTVKIVCDPFCGSGTTLIACKQRGVDFIGFDISEEYCKNAAARIKEVQIPLAASLKEDGFPPNNKLLGIQPTIL